MIEALPSSLEADRAPARTHWVALGWLCLSGSPTPPMDLGKALEGQALPDGLAEPLHGGGSSCLNKTANTQTEVKGPGEQKNQHIN